MTLKPSICLLLGMLSLCFSCVNWPLSLMTSGLSVVFAALSLKDCWRSRKGLDLLIVIVPGVGLALFAAEVARRLRAMEKADDALIKRVANLHSLALAMRCYADEKGSLPPAAVFDKNGKALLSWRVLMLPELEGNGRDEAEPGLFNRFKLDEPWDSPNNFSLLAKMPRIFAPPGEMKTAQPHSTYYRVFVGKGTAFEGTQGVSLDDFPDGIEETIMIVEASEAVPWTKPEDLHYAPDQPLPRLGMVSKYRFFAAFVDGSTKAIRQKVSEKSLRALITRNGHDLPGPDWEPGVSSEDR